MSRTKKRKAIASTSSNASRPEDNEASSEEIDLPGYDSDEVNIPKYEELESKNWIKSKLLKYLEERKWKKAEKRLAKHAYCTIWNNTMTKEEYTHYNHYFKDRLPEEVNFADGFQKLPIHTAALRGAPLQIIKKIIERCPDGLSIQSTMTNGWYPLHMMCRSHEDLSISSLNDKERPEETILWMIKKYPNVLEIKDDSESTPLHTILERNPSFHIVKEMIDYAPSNILLELDVEKQVPLHIALDYKASKSVSNLLICTCPDATKMIMDKGYLPLHFAANSGCSRSTLEKLLIHHPLGVEKCSDNKDTPLHLLFSFYPDKYDYITGKSKNESHASMEEMVKLMLSAYFNAKVQQIGEPRAKKRLSSSWIL